MTKKLPLLVALAAFAVACSDPTTPSPSVLGSSPFTDIITPARTASPPVAFGAIELCKTSNVGGDFDFDATYTAGTALVSGTLDTDPDITIPAGGGTVCTVIYSGSTLSNTGGADQVVIVETANAVPLTNIDIIQYLHPDPNYGTAGSAPRLNDSESEAARTATVKINSDMSRRVTFTNTATVTTGCTYTKGWYQNKNGAPTVVAVDGRTKAQAQTILASTPSPNPDKNLGVTWGDDNLLHNLYQQLLAALLNLGLNATAGPDAVDAAISAALAGTGGTGLNITTTLTHEQMSDLVDVLSDFNEGKFAGWPHCSD